MPPTNPAKTIFGAAYDVEFGNIATAITSKADAVSTISSITGTANQIGVVNVAGAVTLSLPQNVIIPTPASGVALTTTAIASGIAARFTDASTYGVNITHSAFGAGPVINADSGNSLRLAVNGAEALVVGSAGNVTISSPSSGSTLIVNGTNGNSSVAIASTAASSSLIIGYQNVLAGAWSVSSQSTDVMAVGSVGAVALELFTNSTVRMTINNAGAVTIAAPTASTGLAVTGSASQHVANFIANSTAGGSFGVLIEAGTNASDAALEVLNQAASTAYFQVLGNGGVVVGAPTGGNQGLGTVNATGLFVNGGQLFFGVPTSGSTTAAVTDVGKMINTGVNLAINTGIFSQGHILSVYNNSASAITINGTIATMRLAGTATTGNRTLAPRGLATLWFESGAEVIVSGPGVS